MHAALDQKIGATLNDLLLELEVRNTVDQKPADTVISVIDMDLIALAAELLGRGQPTGTGADNSTDSDRSVCGFGGLTHPLWNAVSVM